MSIISALNEVFCSAANFFDRIVGSCANNPLEFQETIESAFWVDTVPGCRILLTAPSTIWCDDNMGVEVFKHFLLVDLGSSKGMEHPFDLEFLKRFAFHLCQETAFMFESSRGSMKGNSIVFPDIPLNRL